MAPHVDTQCAAFQEAIKILARPWSGLILGLLQGGPMRFSQIEGMAKGVGAKILSARLKELEAQGLIQRRVEPGPPVRVDYALTERGEAFDKVAKAIEQWGTELVGAPPCPTAAKKASASATTTERAKPKAHAKAR